MSDHEYRKRVKHEQRRLEDKLDKMIGFYYWRTYWSTSLWANLATPLNLGITIFTALMTAHSSSSSSFISDELNMKINIATFFISIINTFFAPQKQFNELNEYLSKWSDLGNTFEKIIFSDSDPVTKITDYIEVLDNANQVHKEQFAKHRNFVTDLLHIVIRIVFMNSNDRWMNSGPFEFYEKIQDAGIELDFDFKAFKRAHKKASVLERLCTCFSCCFKDQDNPGTNCKHDDTVNTSEHDATNDSDCETQNMFTRETVRVQRSIEMTPVHTVVQIANDSVQEYKNPIADINPEPHNTMSTPDIHELQNVGSVVSRNHAQSEP